MLDLFIFPLGLLYILVVSLLFIYGLNFYHLTYLSIRKQAPSIPPDPPVWPKVTVQLPVYNEMYVIERLIEAAANLDYPRELLEVQVLDDSSDETVQIAQRVIERVRASGTRIQYVHRENRVGFKAGALAGGFGKADGEFIAIFDADFVPGPDFLKQTIPYFQDPGIAFLQTRWSHLNKYYSMLTYLQSLIIDAHFMVEQVARSRGGYWFNFNGTAGVWRKTAIQDAGGWMADTLTEDLDLSYRVLLRGWQAVYLPDVHVPAELPVTFTAYRRQQYRWARGSLEVARKQLPNVIQSPVSLTKKLEAILHLAGYGVHLLLFAISLLYPVVLIMADRYPNLLPLFYFALIFNITALAQSLFFITAQHKLGRSWWKLLPAIFCVSALGAGMMLNTLKAALQIFEKKKAVFERTPKFGIQKKGEDWNHKLYQLGLDRIVFYELGFGMFNLMSFIFAIRHQNWVIAFYAFTFCTGLFFTSGMSIQQALVQNLPGKPAAGGRKLGFGMDKKRMDAEPAIEASLKVSTGRTNHNGQEKAQEKGSQVHPALKQSILETVAYADVFDYPLTGEEIQRYLIGTPATLYQVLTALDEHQRAGLIGSVQGVYMLPGREILADIRRHRQEISARLWKQATFYGGKIARLPFIRMVAVTGALAMDNVDEGADIDYLIVTEPGRLWVSRGLVILIVRLAAHRSTLLCPNYMLSERALAFPDRSLYAAHEITQMSPLNGLDVYLQLRRANRWTDTFLPNASGQPVISWIPDIQTGRHPILSLAENVLRTAPGSWLERWEMDRKIRKLKQVSQGGAECEFNADCCKGHFALHGQKTLRSYTMRMEKIGRLGVIEVEI